MKRCSQLGFSLLEVMLTLVLISSGTVAVMELFQRARIGGTDAESVLIATYLAQRRLEELRNVAYGSLADETETAIASPSGYSRFRRQVEVTTPYTNLRQIVVTITWDAPGPDSEASVRLQTYRSNT